MKVAPFSPFILLLGLVSCQTPREPIKQVQFCLTEQYDREFLKMEFKKIAQKEQLEFWDRSAQTQKELELLGNKLPESYPIINIGVHGNEGVSASAGNSGLPTDQVSVGFGGVQVEHSRAFAQRVIRRLKKYWNVREVANGKGALPLTCDSNKGLR